MRALLGDRPRRRDLLIEHLHLIQDRYGHLSAAHLAALAHEMKLAQTEVYEVATFYAHFDVVKEGEIPPPPVTVRVCDSLSCAMAGAEKLLADLPEKLGPGVRVVRAPCMGACDRAPVCAVGHVQVMKADSESVARRRARARTRIRTSRRSISPRIARRAATRCSAIVSPGKHTREPSSRAWTTPACAGSAARAFPRDANGPWCGRPPARA